MALPQVALPLGRLPLEALPAESLEAREETGKINILYRPVKEAYL
jgi:hypothetical protein